MRGEILFLFWNHRLVRMDVLVLVVGSLLPLPRYSGGFCLLVPPPAAYFPAKESRQSSPGCGPDPGLGGGGIGTGLANPLVATRRLSLRPQYFGHWPLGRISPLQNL